MCEECNEKMFVAGRRAQWEQSATRLGRSQRWFGFTSTGQRQVVENKEAFRIPGFLLRPPSPSCLFV
jgi:hypothetical protein